jgi:hypothetical protein
MYSGLIDRQGERASLTQALIAEARRRQRDRRRRSARLILALAVVIAAVAAGVTGLTAGGEHAPGTSSGWQLAGPTEPMPRQVVVWTGGFRIEVISSRTGGVVRTLATNVGLYRGTPTVAVSTAGVVYFDTARDREEWIESTPLTGGRITTVAAGYLPSISQNGRLLAYVEYASQPEAIVVRNLTTGAIRTWTFVSDVPDISGLSWSPDSRFLAYTASYWADAGQTPVDVTRLLDTRSGGTLVSQRRIPLRRGLDWAGFLTAHVGMAVASYPGDQHSLVAVATGSGRLLRRLILLPRQELSVDNASDGTEGTITADGTGGYVLIATAGPHGYGKIFRWTAHTRLLVSVAGGALRAAWG